MGGTVRLRYEAIDGQVRPGFNESDDLFSVRTTVFGEYDAGPVRFGAELYDSRAYRADRGTPLGTGEVNTLELVQAYLLLEGGLGPAGAASVQAGRFTLNLGSRRLIAADDYRNTTNGYTGVKLDVAPSKRLGATLFAVLPQARLPDDLPSLLDNEPGLDRESFDTRLWGGFLRLGGLLPDLLIEPYYVGFDERDSAGRPTRDRKLHNVAVRIVRDPAAGRFDVEAEGIRQFGHVRASLAPAANRLDVSASFVHLEAGYSFGGAWKPRLSLEYDRASGDGPGAKFGRFDTLYGMRRADFAPAGLYAATGRTNISSPGLRLEATAGKATDGFLAYRALWAAERRDAFSNSGVRDPSGASGSFAGHQIDARVRTWIVPKLLRGEINAVWLGKGRLLRDAPNAPASGDTIYVAISTQAHF
ncbi:hypothetical protein C7I55_16225 [Sphingomonas deserti]|uniref:Alginate export domain-containing protein n=1 Tax=Allosphingosinicella deserti TaxID=2116704 RepID=A0A2P7QMC5_9SPHN|nr:hypothetical protein C7I55_16225 [Sphingomonas deserti]